VARVIHEANPEETSSTERLTALLALQVVNFGVIIASLTIGALTGRIWETALSVLTFVVIRMLTGGFHFKSLDSCFVVSTAVLSAIPHIDVFPWVPTIVAIVLIGIYSRKRRLLPILIIGANLIVGSPVIALAAAAQSLTLIERRWRRNEETTREKSI
jgi:accessory gene regulator B